MKSDDRSAASVVRARVDRGGERVWRLTDFRDLPFAAVAQALSRMTRAGQVERLSKGTYYRSRTTAIGRSRPNPAVLAELAVGRAAVFPAGIAAANLLGLSTQAPRRREVATSAGSLPRKLIGHDTLVHTRRPAAWSSLTEADGALLEFLRDAGLTSELDPRATVHRASTLLREGARFDRLMRVASTEPPRVRAILGALGERIRRDRASLARLRNSLNPHSRFDFGAFIELPNARAWQAKGRVA